MSMEMDTQYNCKIYIPNQTNEYTHNYYTTSLSVPNRTLERSQLSNGLIENIEQEMIEYRNNKFEDRYVAFESNLSEMQHDRIIRDDHSTTPYRRAECPIHVYDRDGVPSRRGNDLNSTKDRKGDEMINYKTFGNSCSNMGREVEDKLNRLIAERVVDGNDNWPLVQIPLEIKYEVFRRRRKGDATNEWSNAYDTTQDPLQCNMPDPECDNEPICC